MIQPHLPIRLPCYDFTPVIRPAFGSSVLSVRSLTSGVTDSHGVTLPIRLPCYDFTPVIRPAFGSSVLSVRSLTSGVTDSHGVTGGVYKTRERIHRARLLAIPASCSRVADCSPNWDVIFGICSASPLCFPLFTPFELQTAVRTGTLFLGFARRHHSASLCLRHCSTCVAQIIRGMMI